MAKKNSSLTLARTIAEAAIEKQAADVVILDLRELDAVTDCFVVCTGGVDQQVRAIADNIEKHVKATTGDRLLNREGQDTANWVILDYVNVVAHIFKPSFREFYRLEDLWGDADVIVVEDDEAEKPKAAPRKTQKSAPVPAARKKSTRTSPARKAAVKKSSARKTPAPTRKKKP